MLTKLFIQKQERRIENYDSLDLVELASDQVQMNVFVNQAILGKCMVL